MRLLVRAPRTVPVPRQRVPPARHLRGGDARDRVDAFRPSRSSGCRPSLAEIASLKNGIVLVTGPTGSGKSSTLAAIIDLHQRDARRAHPHDRGSDRVPASAQEGHRAPAGAAQRYADVRAALRAALRQAPKVILVGEMRDRETIDIALTAAETGAPGFLDAPHHRRVEDRGTHRRHVRRRRAARGAHAPGGVVPLFHLAAPDPEEERRPHGGAGNPQGDHADARLRGAGRHRRARRCWTPCGTASSRACSASTARSRS